MKTTNNTQATIEILDGEALDMGGGSFMLIQECYLYASQAPQRFVSHAGAEWPGARGDAPGSPSYPSTLGLPSDQTAVPVL